MGLLEQVDFSGRMPLLSPKQHFQSSKGTINTVQQGSIIQKYKATMLNPLHQDQIKLVTDLEQKKR